MQEYIKKIWGSGNTTTLIISKDELENIIKIVKTLEDSGLLLRGVSETIQNKDEKQKGGSISMLLGTSGESLLGKGSMLTGKGMNRAEEGFIRAGYGSSIKGKDFHCHLIL